MDASDQELQQYLFDLHGYLVIHNVLGAAEVGELNRLIDAQRLPSPRERIRFGFAAGLHGPDHGFLNWGEPFCRLLDHEAILLCQGWIGPRRDRSGLRTGVMLPTIRNDRLSRPSCRTHRPQPGSGHAHFDCLVR